MTDPFDIRMIMQEAGGYSPEAARFIRDGLAHTVETIHGAEEEDLGSLPADDESMHVDGRQLCMGLRDFALRQYGMLAGPVLRKWGIRTTRDFGAIVFALVDAGLMRKTDEDTIEDFVGVYDFDEEFGPAVAGSAEGSVGLAD